MNNIDNNNNNLPTNNHLHKEVEGMKQHESKLLQQNLAFIEKIAKIETTQNFLSLQQSQFDKKLEDLETNITEEIRTSIANRITDFTNLVTRQQETQQTIIAVQAKQGEQIEEIRRTLDEFSKAQNKLNEHDNRIKSLEENVSRLDEVDKIRTQGKWTLLTAIISGLIAIASTVLGVILK